MYRLNCNYDFSFFSFLISIDYHHHIQLLLITEFGQICCIQEFEAVLLLLPVDTNLNNATQKPISLHQLHWRKLNLCLWLVSICLSPGQKPLQAQPNLLTGRPRGCASCVLPCILLVFLIFSRVSLWLRVGGWVAAVDTTWLQCSFNEGKGRRPPAFCDVSPIRTANDSRLENTAVYRHRLCQGCQYWGSHYCTGLTLKSRYA